MNATTKITWDATTQHWIAQVGGPGCTIARSCSKVLLEDFLDYLEQIPGCQTRGLQPAIGQADVASIT